MQQELLSYIQQEHLFNSKDKILLTVSGGIDSVVMCELFHKAGLQFAIAHCNFQLRADESEGDEQFVKKLAATYKVAFHHTRFDTKTYVKQHKLSTQAAARELRYDWFEKIRKENNYHYIATAHHQGDVIETFFINLIRGTGISGLRSIVPKQGKIIRPLLFTTRKAIQAYAEKNKITYREDSSNASDNYLRNKIRHHLLPVLNEFSPVAESSIMHSIEKLRDAEIVYKQTIDEVRSRICKAERDTIRISISELKKLNPVSAYLYELLKPYGFKGSVTNDILSILNEVSGKEFFGTTHRLVKDRDFLLLQPLPSTLEIPQVYLISKDQLDLETPVFNLEFRTENFSSEKTISKTADIVMIDLDKLKFPLTIRKWQTGDRFQPLGMKGKKKLSDFFIDKKLSLLEKESTWLLCSDDEIVWIIGLRLDERFKVTEKTKTVFCISLIR
ncbi:MAG TPA: tRNA lysidine(34) synthetase TilS [Bacteroidia bacterium]|jgi:tRNA(Ile)-lysidine synthase|nr:tRNA lysidine(34) synthetase TilS [Bacteroidia bacterium]